jgi:hypothetical protein
MKVTPETLNAAASDLTGINTTLTEETAAAATHTTAIATAGADEVSEAITALFNTYGQDFQQIANQARALHQQFTQNMTAAGNAYQQLENANTATFPSPHPIGEGENIFSILRTRHEFQIGFGPYFYTATWGWEKI